MSLAEKWNEYRLKQLGSLPKAIECTVQRAFYAGAEAVDSEYRKRSMALTEFEAEIDHFRSHK